MRNAIGIDLGGTNLRVALVSEEGKILQKETQDVGRARDAESLLQRMTDLIQKTAGDDLKNLAGIGLGLPGICNTKEKVIHQLPHLPDWKDVPVAELLGKTFSCPIVFDNDANMAAVGEHWLGVAKPLNNFILLTLGSGIGGGIFLNGKIWQGDEGFAGEVGHMTIEANGRSCVCGNKGCWETYVASQAFAQKGLTPQEVYTRAEGGNPIAIRFWKEVGSYLGVGIVNLAKVTGVENFILAGGIAKAFRYFEQSCVEEIRKRTYKRMAEHIKVLCSTLEGDGNLLGATRSFFL